MVLYAIFMPYLALQHQMADRKKIRKTIFIIIGSAIGLYILTVIYNAVMLGLAFGVFDKDYTTTDLVNDFNKKRTQIYAVKNYFNSVIPPHSIVEIEFKSNTRIARWGIYPLKTDSDQTVKYLEWDLDMNTKQIDSALKLTGWTKQTLKIIKQKLDAANCIGIKSGAPTRLGYQRSGTGMFFFNLFDTPVPDSLKKHYNDSCTYILVNRKLVLEFGGGAMGGQCFPKPKKED